MKVLSKYLQVDKCDPARVTFQAAKAVRDQLSVDMQLAGEYVEKFSASYTKYKKQAKSATEGIPIYGNWCGPGHGSGTPIDTLDAICKEHDLCYQQCGYFNCGCDEQLILAISQQEHKMKPKERIVALAIATYFKMAPCIP